MHKFEAFASYRYDPFETDLEALKHPPRPARHNQITLDDEAGYYIYQMTWFTRSGEPQRLRGVVGILDLADATPREHPIEALSPIARSVQNRCVYERLVGANSIAWGVVDSPDLDELLDTTGADLVSRVTDSDGVHHRIWLRRQIGIGRQIEDLVCSLPIYLINPSTESAPGELPTRSPVMITPPAQHLSIFPGRLLLFNHVDHDLTDVEPKENHKLGATADLALLPDRPTMYFRDRSELSPYREIHTYHAERMNLEKILNTSTDLRLLSDVSNPMEAFSSSSHDMALYLPATTIQGLLGRHFEQSSPALQNWPTPYPIAGMLLGEQPPH